MSQEKVDQNKELKKNRKKIVKKNRIEKIAWGIGAVICLTAVIGWLGYSAYVKYTEHQKELAGPASTPLNMTALSEYMSDLTADDTENAGDAEVSPDDMDVVSDDAATGAQGETTTDQPATDGSDAQAEGSADNTQDSASGE